MRGTHDRLRIVGLAVNHQTVRAGRAEPVLLEEPVLAKPVILRHGLENLAAGQLPQCHTDMVSTCVWQRLAVIAMSFTSPASAMAVRAAAIGDITIRPAVQG